METFLGWPHGDSHIWHISWIFLFQSFSFRQILCCLCPLAYVNTPKCLYEKWRFYVEWSKWRRCLTLELTIQWFPTIWAFTSSLKNINNSKTLENGFCEGAFFFNYFWSGWCNHVGPEHWIIDLFTDEKLNAAKNFVLMLQLWSTCRQWWAAGRSILAWRAACRPTPGKRKERVPLHLLVLQGSVLRIRYRMFLGVLNPDPLVRVTDPNPIIKQK
jgi:hypothetical protein